MFISFPKADNDEKGQDQPDEEVPRRSVRLDKGCVDVSGFLAQARSAGYGGRFEFEIFARDHDGTETRSILTEAVAVFDTWPNS